MRAQARTRIPFALLLTIPVLVAVGTLSGIAERAGTGTVQARVADGELAVGRSLADDADREFRAVNGVVARVVGRPGFALNMRAGNIDEVASELLRVQRDEPLVSRVAAFDAAGRRIAFAPGYQPPLDAATGGDVRRVGDGPIELTRGSARAVLDRPIEAVGSRVGTLYVEFDLRRAGRGVEQATFGSSGRATLATPDGEVVVSGDPLRRGKRLPKEIVAAMRAGLAETVVEPYRSAETGQLELATVTRLENGWFVVVSQPHDEAFSAVALLRRDIVWSAAGSLLLGALFAVWVAGRHMRARRQLVESEHRARQFTSAAQLAVIGYDSEGAITTWNPAATRIFGWSARDVLGRLLVDLVVPDHVPPDGRHVSMGYGEARDALGRILEAPFAPGVAGSREALARHRDGHEFHVEVMVSSLGLDVRGERVAFLHDISARRQADEARAEARERLIEANEQLRRADALKSDFLAMASHELRTPLTSISGFAKTMLERWNDITDDDKHDFVDIIDGQADRLSRLVADLLTLGRIERGRLELQPVVVSPADAVRRAVRDLGAGDEVTVVDEWPADRAVNIDDDHLQQVLLNLLVNALSYGAAPITVHLDADQFGGLQLEVRDSGAGVPSDFVPHLFERFAQAPDNARRSDGSVGLGLSIVHGLVDANGGWVRYEPVKPHGASFVVTLPMAATVRAVDEAREHA